MNSTQFHVFIFADLSHNSDDDLDESDDDDTEAQQPTRQRPDG
jgi:hypothetical protein